METLPMRWYEVSESPTLRSMAYFNRVNDGSRTLFESVVLPEVIAALKDWKDAKIDSVLIGGLALSHYVRPRTTQDVDVLLASDANIPQSVPNFKRTRAHGFQHNVTHVEVEVVTPSTSSCPANVIAHIIATAKVSDGIKVASPSGLVASKLYRLSAQDKADIIALLKVDNIDLTGFPITPDKLAIVDQLREDAKNDPHPP